MNDIVKLITPKARASFPNLFAPKAFAPGMEAKYSLTLLIPKSADISALREATTQVAKEKWGSKMPKKLKSPLRDGDSDESARPEMAGHWFIRATAKTKPGLVDKDLQAIIDPEDFYAGCWCRASLIPFAYDQAGNQGVSFALLNVQKLKDDEPFTGRVSAEDEFQAVTDDELLD
jgi:hypothetical protein